MEAARQLVINAAARHLLQRVHEDGPQVLIVCVVTGLCPVQAGQSPATTQARASILLHHQIERRRMRKLRSMSKSAVDLVKHLPRRFQNRVRSEERRVGKEGRY